MSPRKRKSGSHGHVTTKPRVRLQESLLNPNFILKRVFRKDGPTLGTEFDSLPQDAFLRGCSRRKKSHCSNKQRELVGNKASNHAFDESQAAAKRRKVFKDTVVLNNQGSHEKSIPTRQHGLGKGLMTVWRVVNPDSGDVPTGVNFKQRKFTAVSSLQTYAPQKPRIDTKKSQKRQPVARRIATRNKVKDKTKPPINREKVKSTKTERPKQPQREKCELFLLGERCLEDVHHFTLLVDDEELELQELQAGPNPVTCAHFTTNRSHGCSLCKGLLDKFPPNSVMRRPPLYEQPWGSSPELVKKLFKVFHFLCTYSEILTICSFTLDEFALAFIDKDSMLLSKVHVALLKFLLTDIETEIVGGFVPRASQNGKFVVLLHSVENQQYVVECWKESLNPLSWTEILRQVYVAANYGSTRNTSRRDGVSKEVNCMAKYGLKPGTLKGALFTVLSEQRNNGMTVVDLAKSSKIAGLNLAATSDELELLISATLSSDITLFEKISCSAFRLRIKSVEDDAAMADSDADDCGSIDDNSIDSDTCISGDESDCDLGTSTVNKRQRTSYENGDDVKTVYTEIDESHPGESWFLGLMDGEYSDLSIEEKLDAFLALVDLLGAGISSRMVDINAPIVDCVPNINRYASGGKIKRWFGRQHNLPSPLCISSGQNQPVDSSAVNLYIKAKASEKESGKQMEDQNEVHPMQSIYLGSDRRYNRYWLFLGPCTGCDPGHKRIYFESSEDGRWEIIDTEEALCSLLSTLDYRGMREAHLLASLRKRQSYMCPAMSDMLTGLGQFTCFGQSELSTSSSSAVSEVDNHVSQTEITKDFPETGRREQQKQNWDRVQDFDLWIWNYFYSNLNAVKYGKRSYHDSLARCECCHDLYWRDEKHCKTCHTTFELDIDLEERYAVHVATCRNQGKSTAYPGHKVLSSQLQVLKAAIHSIESVMPEGALVGAWTKCGHKLWVKRLRRTSNLVEFLQVLGDFVAAIDEEWLCRSNSDLDCNVVTEEVTASFSTMPRTISAVALWVTKLDAAISPYIKKVAIQK